MRRIDPGRCLLAAAALTLLVMLSGCSDGGGIRIEGNGAGSVVSTSPVPRHTTTVKIDPLALLEKDPGVDADIKAALKPCGGHEYPVDTSYGNLTGNSTPDVVINVSTCGDGVGLGGYVYRMVNGRYTEVFKSEQTPVYLDIDKGDLELTRQVYAKGDSLCCPSGEDVIMYHWNGADFTEISHIHSDYGNRAHG